MITSHHPERVWSVKISPQTGSFVFYSSRDLSVHIKASMAMFLGAVISKLLWCDHVNFVLVGILDSHQCWLSRLVLNHLPGFLRQHGFAAHGDWFGGPVSAPSWWALPPLTWFSPISGYKSYLHSSHLCTICLLLCFFYLISLDKSRVQENTGGDSTGKELVIHRAMLETLERSWPIYITK